MPNPIDRLITSAIWEWFVELIWTLKCFTRIELVTSEHIWTVNGIIVVKFV